MKTLDDWLNALGDVSYFLFWGMVIVLMYGLIWKSWKRWYLRGRKQNDTEELLIGMVNWMFGRKLLSWVTNIDLQTERKSSVPTKKAEAK